MDSPVSLTRSARGKATRPTANLASINRAAAPERRVAAVFSFIISFAQRGVIRFIAQTECSQSPVGLLVSTLQKLAANLPRRSLHLILRPGNQNHPILHDERFPPICWI
jgi:hypothetical protein